MSKTTYKANLSGSSTGSKTGQLYRFDGGDEFPGPKGEFDHDDNIFEVKAIKKQSNDKPTDQNTIAQIKKYLDENEIEYDPNAKKSELLKLV